MSTRLRVGMSSPGPVPLGRSASGGLLVLGYCLTLLPELRYNHQNMAHSFASLLAHIVFSTKERRPLIDADLKRHLHSYFGGIVRELGGRALMINGTTDHVHLLVSLPATLAVSELMRILKTNSSRWVHEKWPARKSFGWQTGYGAFSVSESNRKAVQQYIADQEAHHRKLSFEEEFLALIKKHGLEYDPRFVLD